MCRATSVSLTPADGPLTTTPEKEVVAVNGQGCQQMRVTCNSRSPSSDSSMEGRAFKEAKKVGMSHALSLVVFNGGIDGPSGTPVVTALLVCRPDKDWYYTEDGESRAVTEVSCGKTAEPVEREFI
ncbi:hypothetical protein TELCIR_09505 [Teladorsagia circumcincta]|uniref:C6 domain-containing protein n=1 Tax=Teladorsagia circumcincta TaxID=45464 RepID=A0A2G9UEU8_TELCI|nr:hypothetical protein TELCIR_09505 [Teladorsagia circumcincta]